MRAKYHLDSAIEDLELARIEADRGPALVIFLLLMIAERLRERI